jgi:hypothetical protein
MYRPTPRTVRVRPETEEGAFVKKLAAAIVLRAIQDLLQRQASRWRRLNRPGNVAGVDFRAGRVCKLRDMVQLGELKARRGSQASTRADGSRASGTSLAAACPYRRQRPPHCLGPSSQRSRSRLLAKDSVPGRWVGSPVRVWKADERLDQAGWFGVTPALDFSSDPRCSGRPSKPMSPLFPISETSIVRMVGVT